MLEPLKFKMYSGYVPVDEVMGKNLFYWFVESERDPKNDPLLVWMNGGMLKSPDLPLPTHVLIFCF